MAVLRVLEWEGICWQRVVGRASVWKVDESHILIPALTQLARLDEIAGDALRERLERSLRSSQAEEAYLFGSVAQGKERPGSDVDILVVFPNARAAARWKGRLEGVSDEVLRAFSMVLQGLIYTRSQVRSGQSRHLLQEARSKGIRLEVS
jgi:predicted nucleotidyltransferase